MELADALLSGAVGSVPGSPIAGELYFPNNGRNVERYSGSVWTPWGPIFPLTPPVDGDFAWVNQGSATISTTNGGIHLMAPANSGVNLRIRKKSAPATPYTITMGFIPRGINANFQSCGFVFRDAGGLIETFEYNSSGGGSSLGINRFTSASGYSSSPAGKSASFIGALIWMQCADDGANRIYRWSTDAYNWEEIYSVSRTTFLTATEVGFFANDQTTLNANAMTLLSWKET